jgi:tripartite-type tricarboxylate transporter receptor subunit TctC
MSYVKAGTLRALAVTSAVRVDVLPDVPTAAETLPNYEATSWAGIGAPAHTPAEIIDRLNRETNAALAAPKLKAHFGKFIASEIDKWAKVVRFANLKPE